MVALLAAPSARARDLPIAINADHQGRVLVRVQGESKDFHEISPVQPAIFHAQPGHRVDIKVIGRASWWANWSGEQQGCTGPSNVTIRLEKTPAWDRVALFAALLAGSGVGGFLLWKRKTVRAMAAIEHRATVAESGTGIPKKIAGYVIVKLIGEGGMAHVYHGQDSNGRDFAVKVPKTVDERFQRECIIATTLDSPHIVKAFDFCAEKSPGKPAFMAQEMLVGQTLADRIDADKVLPLEDVDSYLSQLLDGLEVAHKQGILHRDLKPENLFLDRATGKETLKILDFGVARADDTLLVTVSGAMLGTPIYSSPEQNRSESKLDHRSDLYSVGLIAYEMLTGQRTWSALNRYDLLKLHNAGLQTRVSDLRQDVPAAWNALVSDMLQLDPALRPADVTAVRRRWAEGRT